ncbi:MAG: protein kinase family protein [Simkaniaceae bacterium]|nr:protein kinase family protein [Simkaniaceae bacterium]
MVFSCCGLKGSPPAIRPDLAPPMLRGELATDEGSGASREVSPNSPLEQRIDAVSVITFAQAAQRPITGLRTGIESPHPSSVTTQPGDEGGCCLGRGEPLAYRPQDVLGAFPLSGSPHSSSVTTQPGDEGGCCLGRGEPLADRPQDVLDAFPLSGSPHSSSVTTQLGDEGGCCLGRGEPLADRPQDVLDAFPFSRSHHPSSLTTQPGDASECCLGRGAPAADRPQRIRYEIEPLPLLVKKKEINGLIDRYRRQLDKVERDLEQQQVRIPKQRTDGFSAASNKAINAREAIQMLIEHLRHCREIMRTRYRLDISEYPIDEKVNLLARTICENGYPRQSKLKKGSCASVYRIDLRGGGAPQDKIALKRENDRHYHEAEMLMWMAAKRVDGVVRPVFIDSRKDRKMIGMELCDCDLHTRYASSKTRLTTRTLKNFLYDFCDVLRTLDRLHTDLNIVHGDLKLCNLLKQGDQVKIADFGGAARKGERMSVATNRYLPPEYPNGKLPGFTNQLNPTMDIWAMGVMAFEVLFHCPFAHQELVTQEAIDAEIIGKVTAFEGATRSELIGIYRDLIGRILRIDPKERPTAREILEMKELGPYLRRPFMVNESSAAAATVERPAASGAGEEE